MKDVKILSNYLKMLNGAEDIPQIWSQKLVVQNIRLIGIINTVMIFVKKLKKCLLMIIIGLKDELIFETQLIVKIDIFIILGRKKYIQNLIIKNVKELERLL